MTVHVTYSGGMPVDLNMGPAQLDVLRAHTQWAEVDRSLGIVTPEPLRTHWDAWLFGDSAPVSPIGDVDQAGAR